MPGGLRAQAVSWWGTNVPTTGPTGTSTTWVCVRFHVTVPGRLAGFRFYDGFIAGGDNSVVGQLWTWTPNRQILRQGKYFWLGTGGANAWRQMWFRPWFRPVVGTDYLVAVAYSGGGFFRNNSALASAVTRNGITFVSSAQSTALLLSLAVLSENTNANAVDVLFYPD